MPLIAVGVLLFSALLHALWNGLLRQAGNRYLAMWWAMVVGATVSLPLLFIAPPMPMYGWGYVLASAFFETLYVLLLVSAYRDGDFSVVYPIARGSAPGLLAIWAFLFLGERPTPLAGIGIAVLVVGLILVGWQARRGQTPPSYRSIVLAGGVAVAISLYSVIDGAAVQTLDVLGYSARVSLVMVLFLTPIILWRFGTGALVAEWRTSAPRLVATGVIMTVAYLLVLGVYQIAPVSYAGAIREVSVVFAALLGKVWFQEQVGIRRAFGVAFIFCGAMLITTG
jgi:drug/metabolite transporter (DMT)-like permease